MDFPGSTLACAIGAALGCSPVLAAQSPPPSTGLLEELVITASRNQQRVFDSPASLSVINEQELNRAIAPSMAAMLRDVAGVQISDSGQPGMSRIRIRGEESRRTAVLVNSQEITDHHEIGTPLSLHISPLGRRVKQP